MTEALSVTKLDEAAVMRLVERGLRREDEKECWIADQSPMKSLLSALDGIGPAYAVWGKVDGYPTPVGAIGLRAGPGEEPAIWSLWTDDLDGAMKRCIFRNTRRFVGRLLIEAGVPSAANFASCSNQLALRWVKASGCFRIASRTETVGKGRHMMQYFQTKPLRELLRNV